MLKCFGRIYQKLRSYNYVSKSLYCLYMYVRATKLMIEKIQLYFDHFPMIFQTSPHPNKDRKFQEICEH